MSGRPSTGDERLVLAAGAARLEIEPSAGGRMTSLVVDGSELLARTGGGPIDWGCFPMAPYPGRIRNGTFDFGGRRIDLPLNLPPHAAHGTVLDRPWSVVDDCTLSIDLGPDWPFAGRLTQCFDLTPDGLDVSLRLEADEPMPAAIGWHPWFVRRLTGITDQPLPPSAPAVLGFEAARMFERDADGIPTGALIEPTPRPWDDCFTDLLAAPTLTWPGVLRLKLASSCAFWVVYDEPVDAICIEPQSAPPDFVHLDPPVVEPGRPRLETMRWRWRPADSDEPDGDIG